MKKIIQYKSISLNYSISGSGPALVFIHGYLESSNIWESFIPRFEKDFTVICPDTPGHGESGVLGEVHEMDEMASVVDAILIAEKIEKATLFGHSMGGYITMSFVRMYPEKLNAYCLFHSTPFADNDEKKRNRDREIALVNCGKKKHIIRTNIPRAFADDNIERLSDAVERAKEIAESCEDNGVVALLNGMKNRQDHSELLISGKIPSLIIWGRKDNYIIEEVFEKLKAVAPNSELLILDNSGHMGFIEEPDLAFEGIVSFLTNPK